MRPPRVKGPSDDPPSHLACLKTGWPKSWWNLLIQLLKRTLRTEKERERKRERKLYATHCQRPWLSEYYTVQPLLPWFFNLYRHIFAQLTEINDWLQSKNVKDLFHSLHKGNYWYEWATIASITTLREIQKLRQFIFSSARLAPSWDLLTPLPPLPPRRGRAPITGLYRTVPFYKEHNYEDKRFFMNWRCQLINRNSKNPVSSYYFFQVLLANKSN